MPGDAKDAWAALDFTRRDPAFPCRDVPCGRQTVLTDLRGRGTENQGSGFALQGADA